MFINVRIVQIIINKIEVQLIGITWGISFGDCYKFSFSLIKNLRGETIKEIGMKEWLEPQISEHCPVNNPSRFLINVVWLIRPGIASIFEPIEGTVHEWITSWDVTIIRTLQWDGILTVSLHFSKREIMDFSMKHSISVSSIIPDSYDQYHWCPTAFIVSTGLLKSSVK